MNNLDSRSLLALEINNQLASSGTESDFYQQELNPAKTIINQSSKLKKTVPFLAILFFFSCSNSRLFVFNTKFTY